LNESGPGSRSAPRASSRLAPLFDHDAATISLRLLYDIDVHGLCARALLTHWPVSKFGIILTALDNFYFSPCALLCRKLSEAVPYWVHFRRKFAPDSIHPACG
jgi:hypothetical protein